MPDDVSPMGIRAFDLMLPTEPLVPVWEPLRHQGWPSAAEQIAARQDAQKRQERVRQAGEAAVDDWTEFRTQHADNPLAAVALDIHQPVAEWDRVVCQECRESDLDDTVGVEWPCGTYAAMKAAADG